MLKDKQDFKECAWDVCTHWVNEMELKMKGLRRLDQIVKNLKKKIKDHFEEFELDPGAVKKLLKPFKQKMDIM